MSSATTTAGAGPTDRASLTTWISVFSGLLGAFMAVLNIQITNASLPQIEGGIGTGVDNGAWISTSYLIGEIIVIPLTAYLSQVFGFRRFLLVNTTLFLVFSVACAFAANLGEMILLRGIQGFTGGVLIPMAFTLVMTRLPLSQRPMGMALFAITATFAPAIGPTIGGWLTDNYGWEYIFYINLVPGAVMLAGLAATLEREPMRLSPAEGGRLVRHRRHGDRPGVAADGAGGGQQGRLVRLALHRPADRHRRRLPGAVPVDRAAGGQAGGRPAAAAAPQFRLRHAGQRVPRLRPVRQRLSAAAISGPGAGL